MAFRFDLSVAPGAEARRVLVEQTDRALHALNDPDGPGNVHTARKSLKRCRALLALVRRGLRRKKVDALNMLYRDAGRLLSGARDAEVARKVLAIVVTEAKIPKYASLLPVVDKHTDPADVKIARAMLEDARARLEKLAWGSLSEEVILGGLERSYARARQDLARTRSTSDPEVVHDWRKRVKAWGYHLQLVRGVWPVMMEPLLAVVDDLQEALGDHHDVSVVREAVLAETGKVPPRLAKALTAREDRFVATAWSLGGPLLAARPEVHSEWFGALWAEASRPAS